MTGTLDIQFSPPVSTMFSLVSSSRRASPVVDFRSLPQDIVLRILLFCDIESLFVCKRVSRPLHHLIDADVYLQYKTELVLNGMIDGPASCTMNIVEKLQLLRDYSAQYHGTKFAVSDFDYSWQRWPEDETMPTTDWEGLLGFGGSIAYIVIKPPQKQISVCAPPTFTAPRKMRDWVVPYEALSKRPGLVVVSVSVDISQDLLLVSVEGEDPRHLYVLIRSLDNPKEAHPRSLQPTLAVTVSHDLGPAGASVLNPAILRADNIQIYENIVAWKLLDKFDLSGPCDIELWDWRIGQRLWCSHYTSSASFSLLDDAHIVTTTGPSYQELVVQCFSRGAGGQESGLVLTLGLPPQHGSVQIQESSIPSPPSPAQPFWTDPALRMVVVGLADEFALLIPYKTFCEEISVTLAKQHTSGRKEPTRLAWEDWRAKAIPLAPTVTWPSPLRRWQFENCHSYGSRVVVNAFEQIAVVFDLNPWAARNARRFPRQVLSSGEDKDPKDLFRMKDVAFPHAAILREWYYGVGLGQSTPGLATDPMGFTEVYSMSLRMHRFLGSISHYVRSEL